MASAVPQANGAVPFALRDGTTGIIPPEARRTYDHIIGFRIGSFPSIGLTDTQAKLILQGSHLNENDLERIWQITESIDAPGFPDGNWTQLEIYVALYFAQSSERLFLDQMARQYTGSMPLETTSEIRRRSSYAEAGLALRPRADHDPMPSPASPPLTAIRHSASIVTTLTGMRDLDLEQAKSNQATFRQDNTSTSQPGLEAIQPFHASNFRYIGGPGSLVRASSLKSDTTSGAQRLASLIQSRCPHVQIEPIIERFQPGPVESSIVDRLVARDVLVRKRREGPKFKDPSKGLGVLFKSKKDKKKAADGGTWTFRPYELSLALREAVEESNDVGVAKALIDMGADVGSFVQSKSKLIGSRVDCVPINYIKIAANKNNTDMVSLFATSGVSPNNLVEALEQAVEQNLPNIVLVLLQHGVDPNAQNGSIFASAIASQNPVLVKRLLRSRSKIRKDLLTNNLPTAVEKGQIEIVSLLVIHGADPKFENALALRKAVQAQRIDVVLAIMKGVEGVARSNIASSVIGEAFPPSSLLTVPEQRLLIEVLLCAGARGDPVARLLAPVVRAGYQSIAKLLVKHGANLHYNDTEALRIAVAADNLHMLSTLLLGRVTKEVAGNLVGSIPHTCNDDRTYEIVSLLIDKGARGSPLDQALLRAVQRKFNKTISLLLDHHASVDVEDSQPLRMAVTDGDLVILNLLLSKGKPRPKSMALLLPLIPQSSHRLRFDMTTSVINAAGKNGIATSVLSDALLGALKHPLQDIGRTLVPLVDVLIAAGASVDYQQGKCFRLAAEVGSMKLLALLIENMSEQISLLPAMHVCMKMKDLGKRQKFVALLLKHGARGPEVNQALIDAIEERPLDEILVGSLLETADVEYHEGRALSVAIRSPSVKLVASIIETGRTSQKSRLVAGQILFEPRTKERQAKLHLLLRAGIGQDGLDDALIREMSGERSYNVVKMLLDHKASCEYEGGKSLELAIRHHDNQVLEQLVAKPPDHRILEEMIPKACSIKNPRSRHTCLSLLIHGGAVGERLSFALVQEVETPDHRDLRIIQLLVASGARIDYSNGRAIKFAVSSPLEIGILKLLVSGMAASVVLTALIPAAMSHRQSLRLPLLQILLENGATGDHVNAALVTAVTEGPKAQPTVNLLLKYKASVNHNKAEAIKVAALAGSSSLLESLLVQKPNPEFFEQALSLAMQSPASTARAKAPDRLHSVRLLTRPNATRPGATDLPLIQAVEEKDYDLIEFLINSEANPNFNGGKSVVIATQQLDIRSLRLLVRSKSRLTPQSCSRAFDIMPHDRNRWQKDSELIDEFDSILIPGGAVGPAVDQTFLSASRSSRAIADKFISLILMCKTELNVNFEDGRSLCIAVRRARFKIVDFLLLQGPSETTLQAAFIAIFESGAEEQILIMLAQRLFEYSGKAKHIYFRQDETANDPLYQTLHRHGDKPTLLQTLFDNGCRTTSTFSWVFNDRLGIEETSALLWLLCQETEKLNSQIVRVLLKQAADPNFRTFKSGITPLIIAASSSQPEIVLQLLEAGAQPDTQDDVGRTALQYATMAGSQASMEQLLNHNAEIDDESLHIAARQLEIPTMKLLIDRGASATLPGTVHCDGRIPFGELLRMANVHQNPPQLKKAIKFLFGATTELKLLSHGKSLIFQALDNDSALKMTTALLLSCQSFREDMNEDYNIFASGSRRYSPSAYIRHFKCIEPSGHHSFDFSRRCCKFEDCPAPDLEKLLRAYGFKDRFWDAKAGVSQPKGFCNPPFDIVTAIRDDENRRREQEQIARARAEEKARKERLEREEKDRKDRIQRDLDNAAAAERRRERERLKVIEEERAVEIRATERRAAAKKKAIEQRTEAKLREKQRLADEEAREADAKRQREQREYNEQRTRERTFFNEQQERKRQNDQQAASALKERSNIQINQKRREANLQTELFKEERNLVGEKRKLVDSATGMFREAGYQGVSRVGMGRVLGEIDQ